MQKGKVIRLANGLLLVSFLVQFATSVVLFLNLNIRSFELVEEVHEYNGLVFILLVLTHIVLHWHAIKMMFSKK